MRTDPQKSSLNLILSMNLKNQYRGKIIKDYYTLCKIKPDSVEFLFIGDTRKNPVDLLNLVKNFNQ